MKQNQQVKLNNMQVDNIAPFLKAYVKEEKKYTRGRRNQKSNIFNTMTVLRGTKKFRPEDHQFFSTHLNIYSCKTSNTIVTLHTF